MIGRTVRRWVIGIRGFALRLLPEGLISPLRSMVRLPFGNKYYGDRAVRYDADRKHQPDWEAELRAAKSLLSDMEAGSKILDVPVGSGRFFPIYAAKSCAVTAFDISEDMLDVARARAIAESLDGAEFVHGDARKMPFPDGSFDFVVCFRFLQSIISYADARKVLAEIARVSRGFALLHMQFQSDGEPQGSDPRGWEPMRGKLSLEKIDLLLEQIGFSVEQSVTISVEAGAENIAILCRSK